MRLSYTGWAAFRGIVGGVLGVARPRSIPLRVLRERHAALGGRPDDARLGDRPTVPAARAEGAVDLKEMLTRPRSTDGCSRSNPSGTRPVFSATASIRRPLLARLAWGVRLEPLHHIRDRARPLWRSFIGEGRLPLALAASEDRPPRR